MIIKFNEADRIDCTGMIGEQAISSHASRLISSDADIFIGDRLVASYRVLSGEVLAIARAITKGSKLVSGKRTNGLSVKNAVYGYLPRNPTRCNYCRPTSASINSPAMNSLANRYADIISRVYSEVNNEQFLIDRSKIDAAVLSNWRINQSMWSSLNVNVNFSIKYHRDTGNWPGIFSNVFIYREGCTGGNLILPEFSLSFKQISGACIFFAGGELIHGVTPIQVTSPLAVRSSVVLYTMSDMRHCSTLAGEAAAHSERVDEIALEKRLGNPKLRTRYSAKIDRLIRERESDL